MIRKIFKNKKKYKLCYIDGKTAFFTKKELKDQWGDDWNDVPYEHNAGEPYYDREDDIIKICFIADEYKKPCEEFHNSPYSVEQINNKEIAWLSSRYKDSKLKPIFAGCDINNFINLILLANGEIFLPLKILKKFLKT